MGSGDLDNQVKTDEVLAEVQRRMQERQESAPDDRTQSRRETALRLNKGVLWLARHWLAVFNLIAGLYIGGALLAPVLMHYGATGAAHALYRFYAPFCHQYPFRSWFFFGPELAHRLDTPISIAEMNHLRAFLGNAEIGYKTALCQRDVAIYGMVFLGGLGYGLLRDRFKIRPLSIWVYLALGILPMLLDGGIQWLTYLIWTLFPNVLSRPFETYPILRTITGALFGLGIVGMAYPYVNQYFGEIRDTIVQKYNL